MVACARAVLYVVLQIQINIIRYFVICRCCCRCRCHHSCCSLQRRGPILTPVSRWCIAVNCSRPFDYDFWIFYHVIQQYPWSHPPVVNVSEKKNTPCIKRYPSSFILFYFLVETNCVHGKLKASIKIFV